MHIINLYIRGGNVQGVYIPKNCDAIVRIVDYDCDCEGTDCPDTDDEGNPCTVALYEANEEEL